MFVARRIDNRQRPGISITESGVQIFRLRIVTHLVRVRTKLQAVDEFKSVPAEDLAGAVSAVSHKESLKVRGIKCALRSALSGDAGNPFARFEIDNLNRVLLFVIGGNE